MTQSTVICVALVAALGVMVAAQQPLDCQSIAGMKDVNATNFAGWWYEVARAPAVNSSCIQSNIVLFNNNTQLNVTTSYSSSNSSLYMNKHDTVQINATEVNTNTGFNVTLSGTNSPVTFKIVDTDNSTFVTLCGYTSSSSFGMVFARNTNVNYTWLGEIVANTSKVLLNFDSSTVANVTQKGCYASSASTSVPYLTTMFALLFVVAKLLN